MSAWGIGPFENDDAMDWVGEFAEQPSLEALGEALRAVVQAQERYVEAPEASTAIAAAELVAALHGAPHSQVPDELQAWIRRQAGKSRPELLNLARRAVERVAADSELRELWDETEEGAAWRQGVNDLCSRLAG